MKTLVAYYNKVHDCIARFDVLDGLPLLGMRLFLAPVMMIAGWNKFENFAGTVAWFESLGIPFAGPMCFLAASAELVGGILLMLGLAVRWASAPLAATMLVAIITVHWSHGWFAIAPSNTATSPARAGVVLNVPGAEKSLENSEVVSQRLREVRSLLRQHGDYDRLTDRGPLAVLNNGIEFAVTYLLMLLVLMFYGGGRHVSIDHLLARKFRPQE